MTDSTSVPAWDDDEILAAWGLQQLPFADFSTERFFFPGEQHLRALDFMRRVLCSRVSAGVIIGERGVGKTLLVRNFVAGLDDRILLAHVQRTDFTPREFLYEVLRQFGMELDQDERTDYRLLLQRYLSHEVSNGRICLLLVENAQAMHPTVLEEILVIGSMQVNGSRLIKMLLLGQPMLLKVVDSPRLTGLVPASVPRVVIAGLSEDQLSAYVAHRLRVAGAVDPDTLFDPGLIAALHRLTGGVPATVNMLCARALKLGAETGLARMTLQCLMDAAQQCGLATTWEQVSLDGMSVHPGEALLLVSSRGGVDQIISMRNDRVLIGRGEGADLRIDSTFVSRHHALIVREPHQDWLIDLGSTNGLLVNGKRVVRCALKHRDLIQIGPARISYISPDTQGTSAETGDELSRTMTFARPGAVANDEHSVFAFGRFDDAG